jgi:hypothetical protein
MRMSEVRSLPAAPNFMLYTQLHTGPDMINYHKHLYGCEHNETTKRICLACKFNAWQSQSKKQPSVVDKTFEQLLTRQDKELLRDMLITYDKEQQ